MPGGSKGLHCRRWAEARGIPFHAPDLNVPRFEDLTVTAQVEKVEALLASLQLPPVLVGSSLGGFVATAVAHRGAKLHALVLLAPAIHFAHRRSTSESWAGYRARGEMEIFHFGTRRLMRLGPALGQDLRHWEGDHGWRIAVPTEVLHGRHDDTVPVAESEAYAARNPSARLHILDDDHGLLAPPSLRRLDEALARAFSLA